MTPNLKENDINLQTQSLSSNEIAKLVPYDLVLYIIRGFNKIHGVSIAVILEKDEDDAKLSKGTGKMYITEEKDWEPYCLFLRNYSDETINKRCSSYDKKMFHSVRKKVMSNPNWKGELYFCSSGNLREFVMPIVERQSNTFIGVILGGQMRPKESSRAAKSRLKSFIAKEENKCLRSIPFRTLSKKYLKVRQTTEEELREMQSECEVLARELAAPVELFIKTKKSDNKEKIEMGLTNIIDMNLAEARDLSVFWDRMNIVLNVVRDTFHFDWGMALKTAKYSPRDKIVSKTKSVVGRGLGVRENLLNKEFVFQINGLCDIEISQRLPKFLTQDIGSIVAGQPECWWIPLKTINDSLFGAMIFGSSPLHPHTEYNRQYVQQWVDLFPKIALKIGTRYHQLEIIEKRKEDAQQLEQSLAREKESTSTLEDTLIGLTHILKSPISFAKKALWMVGNVNDTFPRSRIQAAVNSGIVVTEHAELLCKGISKIFAPKTNGRSQYSPVAINVNKELRTLSQAMKQVKGREDISFSYFAETPTVKMDKDSFLFVFYTLIDNAIKYADPNTTIQLLYTEERSLKKHALKVKSIGLPIFDTSCVFRKFRRGKNASQRDESGIGFGCWAAREHMLRQGGDITVAIDRRLSVFIVHLPPESVKGI